MSANQACFPISVMARVLGVSEAGYYVWSRRVVGWAMANHLRAELVVDALNMALGQRRPRDVIHHSDQGSQGRIKWSSQHLDGGLRWALGSGARIGPGEVFCVRRVDQG